MLDDNDDWTPTKVIFISVVVVLIYGAMLSVPILAMFTECK